MPKCPECHRFTHLTRRGPTRVNFYALICVLAALLYAVFMWGTDHLFHSKLKTPGHYLASGAFFATLFYWLMLAVVHSKHTGQPINWRSLFWRVVIAMGLLFVAYALVDWVRV